jgi:hypothetical protein
MNALLAFGLALTTATQMRWPGIPLGIGEASLFLWLGLTLLRQFTGGPVLNHRALLRVGLFWVALTLALSVGTCVALLSNFLFLESMLHDAEAYLMMAALSCLIITTMDADHALPETLWWLLTFWNIGLVLQIAAGWGLIALPSVDPWYWDRFRGWSENPNQIALICAVLAPLSLHVAVSSKGLGRVAGLFSCLLTLIMGRLTKSDTFLVSMAVVTGLFMILRLRSWLSSPEYRHSLRFAIAVLGVAVIVPLSLSLAPFVMAANVEQLALSLTKDGGNEATKATANLRLYLWGEAWRTGLETGSLGLGPGPHLERPMGPKRAIPVPFETHNTILELFTQGGLLAVMAVCSLFAGTFLVTLRARLDVLAALTAVIVIFSISHFVLRQPIIWFALVLSLILGTQQKLITQED